jgi:hypothetical protein
MTAGPAARVGALLRLLRPAADELVVALDERAGNDVAAAAGAADTVVRYRYREPVDRPLRWLFSLCTADWILNVDDDEIPSTALLEQLPVLVAAIDVTHYWLLRKWLWPDAGRAIAEHPWSVDYQLRLVANDPRLLRFPSETHRPLEALGPHRYVRAPLYHADPVLNPLERREAKARKYEALRPGKRTAVGPMNLMFVPERRPSLRTEPLPEADVELVHAVLDAGPPSADAAPEAALADDRELEALWAGRALEPDDYRARIELLDEPGALVVGERRQYDVRVENLGGTSWPWSERGEPEIRLSYRWLGPEGDVVEHGLRTALPAELAPGESQVVPLHVLAPDRPGRYRLNPDLVHEHVRWFGLEDWCEVEVGRRLRVALLGDADGIERVLERLTEEAPELEPLVLSSEPGPRYGPPRAPDLRAYLLEDAGRGAIRDLRLLSTRTLALLGEARRQVGGEPGRPLLRGAQEFLVEVGTCTQLLLVAPSRETGTRELWLQAATIAAARELGVEVLVQEGALAGARGSLDRVLVRGALRRAKLVGPGELGLAGR